MPLWCAPIGRNPPEFAAPMNVAIRYRREKISAVWAPVQVREPRALRRGSTESCLSIREIHHLHGWERDDRKRSSVRCDSQSEDPFLLIPDVAFDACSKISSDHRH